MLSMDVYAKLDSSMKMDYARVSLLLNCWMVWDEGMEGATDNGIIIVSCYKRRECTVSSLLLLFSLSSL